MIYLTRNPTPSPHSCSALTWASKQVAVQSAGANGQDTQTAPQPNFKEAHLPFKASLPWPRVRARGRLAAFFLLRLPPPPPPSQVPCIKAL